MPPSGGWAYRCEDWTGTARADQTLVIPRHAVLSACRPMGVVSDTPSRPPWLLPAPWYRVVEGAASTPAVLIRASTGPTRTMEIVKRHLRPPPTPEQSRCGPDRRTGFPVATLKERLVRGDRLPQFFGCQGHTPSRTLWHSLRFLTLLRREWGTHTGGNHVPPIGWRHCHRASLPLLYVPPFFVWGSGSPFISLSA